ncbi:hypothetical protein AAU61_21120 [Desulfocarbo indianensis]|nr:hypothetical protein AAU61_21120 [Desulfocarbo indianensis]
MKRFNQVCLMGMAIMAALYLAAQLIGGAQISQARQAVEPAKQFKVELASNAEIPATVNRMAVEGWELCGQARDGAGWKYLYFQKTSQR